MDDGIELAATLYIPPSSAGPQPCLLEALPYRKDDLTHSYESEYVRLRDEYGYAVCRLDLRGTGSSGGDAVDEYPAQEQRDLSVVIDWLAAQPWCTGAVGMYGTSYSGFNALQMACERPPALRAVVAIYATDDRYTDDVHYRGGALRLVDLVDYCQYMTPMCALPPVPAVWGADWREEWVRRIDALEPWLLTWLEEQHDGAYWRHGSVRPDYARIECPVMLVAGWADGYRNNSFRTVEALRANDVPHRLLAGPWAHASPQTAAPGPRIDLLPEMVAWWDRWLRGRDNGVDDGRDGRPGVTCFVRSWSPPAPDLDLHAGFWVRENWPSPRISWREWEVDGREPYAVRPEVGVDAWIDCAGHLPWGQSGDQRFDDAASLTWQWDLSAPLVVLGQGILRLRVSVDQPVAFCAVKLCDVSPDGTSALVARGFVSLTGRDDLRTPAPLVPGRELEVDVDLDACAYEFAAGHLLRLSIAGADWPNTTAPPRPVTMTVLGGELGLPVWQGDSPHDPPKFQPGAETSSEDSSGVVWRIDRDVLRRTTECVVDHGAEYAVGYGGTAREHYSGAVGVDTRDFGQWARAAASFDLTWPEVAVSTHAGLRVDIDEDAYDVAITLEAHEDGQLVRSREWRRRFDRRLQ